MAITYSSPTLTITGNYDSGTATGGSSTTLVDTSKSWTNDALIGRLVWNATLEATGYINDNTATTLTVDNWHKVDPSTKLITFETAAASDSYVICYNFADIVAADASGGWGVAVWADPTMGLPRTLILDAAIVLSSSGFLGEAGRNLIHNGNDQWITSTDTGSFFQMGKINTSGYGVDGGTYSVNFDGSPSYPHPNFFAPWRMFGGEICCNRGVSEAVNAYLSYNYTDYSSMTGFSWIDSKIHRLNQLLTDKEFMLRNRYYGAVAFYGAASVWLENSIHNWSISPRSDGSYTMDGGDLFDSTVTGIVDSGIIQSPIFHYQAKQPEGTTYFWNFSAPEYTVNNYCIWYNGGEADVANYFGHTVAIQVNDSAGDPIEAARIVCADTNGDEGWVTAKGLVGANYVPTMSYGIVTDASGTYEGPFGVDEGGFVIRDRIVRVGTGTTTDTTPTTYYPWTVWVKAYNYSASKTIQNWDERSSLASVLQDDSFISETTQATAAAYDFAINFATGAITVTDDNTSNAIQKLYDFCQAKWCSSDGDSYENPITTADGITFTLGTGYTLETGAYIFKDITKILADKDNDLTVSAGGVFEDKEIVVWESGGSTYYARHVYRNIKDLATISNQQYAVVSCWDTDSDIDVTYNTSFVNGGLTSDASGNVEGYYVYKKDGDTYSLTEYIGLYGFTWVTLPVESTAASIGTSGTYSTVLLVADSNVTLSRVNALAVSGITVTHATSVMDISDEEYSPAQDNLKARQARTDVIEAGKKGYVSYYEEGHLLAFDGTFYTASSGWIIQNSGFNGTLKDSILELDTAGTYNIGLYDTQVNLEDQDGTFDLRGATITGTLTVDTDTTGITVQLTPGTSYTNNDAVNITVEASSAVPITLTNLVAGSRVFIWDTDGDQLIDNAIEATTTYQENYTYTIDVDIQIHIAYVSGTTAYKFYTATGTITSSGFTLNVSQETDTVYEDNNIDGSTVDECSINANGIDIDVDDHDNTTTAQRIYAWYQNYLFDEDGIADSEDYITARDQTHYTFDDTLQIKNLDTSNPLEITGANIVPTTGLATAIFDLSNGASIALNFERVEAFTYATGSGLSAAQAAQLTAIEADTAELQGDWEDGGRLDEILDGTLKEDNWLNLK